MKNILVPKKAPARFELAISCLLDRRFNQLSHGAGVLNKQKKSLLFKPDTQISPLFLKRAVSVVVITSALHAEGRQFEPGTAQFWTDWNWFQVQKSATVGASVAQ